MQLYTAPETRLVNMVDLRNRCISYDFKVFCFTNSHISDYHQCGKCHKLGHGQMECDDEKKIKELNECVNKAKYIKQSESCTIIDCNQYWTHNTIGHICRQCNQRHSEELCTKDKKNIQRPICKKLHNTNINKNQIFD